MAPLALNRTAWTAWSALAVPPATRAAVEAARPTADDELVVARIDNDGYVVGVFGPLPGITQGEPAAFVDRYRYSLDLVLIGDTLLTRKDYRGDRAALRREARSLAALSGRARVPALHHVDEAAGRLYKSFVPGPTLRDRLVEAGAAILSRETENDPALAALPPLARLAEVWARGRARFADCLPPGFVERLGEELGRIHRCGVTGVSLTFGNVVLEPGSDAPWLIDFDAARLRRGILDPFHWLGRRRDRRVFRHVYCPAR